MSRMESLYARLPIWAQNAACSYVGYRINRRRYNAAFEQLLTGYLARLGLNATELIGYRDRQLAAFVKHAVIGSPFYRRRFGDAHVSASDIARLSDLTRLPILTKAEVQSNVSSLISESVPAKDCITHHTSGTTGAGLVFPSTHEAQRHQWAVWWRYRQMLGLEFAMWCGLFGGRTIVPRTQDRPPFWRVSRPNHRILFSGYHLRPDWIPLYIDEIQRRKLEWLHGYPSHLVLIAQYLLDHRIKLNPALKYVTTGAESLLDHQRSILEQGFGCRVRQHYGLAEAVANISECPFGRLHVDEDFSAVEFVPIDGSSGYRIVGTNFTNPAFPLIRYDTGDVAFGVADSNNCPCGRIGRTVARIDGRIEDYIVLNDGTRVGRLDHILKDLTTVREAQFVQKQPGRLVLRIVRGPEFGPDDEQRIREESYQRLGNDLNLTVEYCESLPRSATGKLRFVLTESEAGDRPPAS